MSGAKERNPKMNGKERGVKGEKPNINMNNKQHYHHNTSHHLFLSFFSPR